MSAARVKSGWEIPEAAAKVFDQIREINERLDRIEAEDKRRAAARDAAKAMHTE